MGCNQDINPGKTKKIDTALTSIHGIKVTSVYGGWKNNINVPLTKTKKVTIPYNVYFDLDKEIQ